MSKKSTVSTELTNLFPGWSKVRTDELSVGYQSLNAIGGPMEKMQKQLIVQQANAHLSTANIDEIDILQKVILPRSFEFELDLSDPLLTCPIPPTVSGLQDGTWYTVSIADNNDIETFWYTSIPNRVSLGMVVSGFDDQLLSFDAEDSPQSGIFKHHYADTSLNGGHLWIEATGGVQYLTFNNEREIDRAQLLLEGVTRKGTEEKETLIIAWDQKQRTLKEWEKLTKVCAINIEDGVQIDIRSSDHDAGPYLSPWNIRFSKNRKKIDEFWDLGYEDGIASLDRIEYTSDEWQQLILGFSGRDVIQRFELLEATEDVVSGMGITVSGIDMAIQPFTDNAWVLTETGELHCYDIRQEVASGIDLLRDRTPGSNVQIELEKTEVILGEDIDFIPWHAEPLKEIQSYRIWYQRPDGEKFGILDGAAVAFTSDFTVKIVEGTPLTRTIENIIAIPTTQRGSYLLVIEATFVDGETHIYKTIVTVNYKTPLVSLDISPIILGTPDGIEFDSDNELWIRTTANDYYQINLHTDVMLVDYDQKIVYFKEDYSTVDIGDD